MIQVTFIEKENGKALASQCHPVEAYAWFSIVAANGDKTAKESSAEAKAQLTPEQLAEAQKRVTQLSEQINANKDKD